MLRDETVHQCRERLFTEGRRRQFVKGGGRLFVKRGRRPSSKGRASLLREGGGHKGEGKLFVEAGEPIGQGKDEANVKGRRTVIH